MKGAPLAAAASIWMGSASINSDTWAPTAARRVTASVTLSSWPATSRPPSVVTSVRFSGTRQTKWGLMRQAMPIISSVTAISRFILVWIVWRRISTSRSVMWRRSSRRCTVMPSAPACSATKAACTGSGYWVPRALRRVAIWSMFTPR